MFIVADRVQETTNSPGTGTATLLGAVSGYQSFSTGIGANNTTYYTIADQTGSNWDVGLGALNSTGTVLTRTTVYSSSNGGSTVNFATGLQYVWCDYPSSKAVLQGTAVNFSSIGATTAGTGAFTTLSASSTVSGAGFSNYFAAPPTIGNTTPNAGAFTTLSASSTVSGTGFSTYLASPPAIGGTTASTGAFTTLSASSTVSGTGFSNYFAAPPTIGNTTPNTGAFTNLSYTGTLTGGTGVVNLGSGQFYKDASGNVLVGITSARANAGDIQVSKGISFPATQSPQSDPNTLDDYEEGTWTPNQGAGLTVVGAFNSSGSYTKIGRLVTVCGLINPATSVLSSVGGVISSNLPFTCGSVGSVGSVADSNGNGGSALVPGAGTSIYSYPGHTASPGIYFSATYFV